MNSYQKSKDAFDSGLCCAESVLIVIAEEEGIQSDILPRIATGFCGGISRTCNMCGAVTGGILAINLVYGRESANDSAEENYRAVQKLISNFEEEFGSVNCQELLGCNLGTDEGQQIFHDKQLRLNCSEYVGKATEFARKIIDSTP
ncbi:C-GCAxxG-C-C family protein [Anaerolineales bacterium HSG24]|nr:C-GCAxxG-C-C family protein [Anaerolineales bacterium HSG24]